MDPKFADNKGQNSRHTGIMVLKNIMGMAQINSWGWKAWKECVLSCFNGVPLCATLWTVACQVPLSMEFSRQGYWRGLPCPLQGIFLTQVSNSHLISPALVGGFFSTSTTWEALTCLYGFIFQTHNLLA